MIGLKTVLRGNPLRSSGVDGTGDASRTRVSATRRTIGHGGLMTVGWNRTHSPPNTVQLTGRRCRGGGRSAVKRIPDGAVLRKDNQWGIPQKCALFISDGPDSTTSGSDILEGHYDRPPEEGYSDVHSTGRPHDVHVAEELCSPSEHLEKAVVRLQQDIADYRAELELNRTQTPAVSTRPPKWSGFMSTSVPRFDGTGCWQQHILIIRAIMKSNGWSMTTAALQLFAHLDGEALHVALLMPDKIRERWKDLVTGLSEYYTTPGRLAVFRRQFENAYRRPGMDPATFATELGILAVRGFADMNGKARNDSFIVA